MRTLLTIAAAAWLASALLSVQPRTAQFLAQALTGASIVIWAMCAGFLTFLAMWQGY